MADFPTSIYAPRTKENKSGIVYDPTKTKSIFAEDVIKLDAEVVSIENQLRNTILTGLKYPRISAINFSAGFTNLYTVPAGKKAYLMFNWIARNIGSSAYYEMQIYPSSSGNIKIPFGSTLATNAVSTVNQGIGVFLNSGDVLKIYVGSGGSINLSISIMEFDDTFPVSTVRLFTGSAGDSTLYTCPVGKTAQIFDFSTLGTYVGFHNQSISTRTYRLNIVPFGSTPSNSNLIIPDFNVSAGGFSQKNVHQTLNPGDSISIYQDGSTYLQAFWVNIIEV